MTVGIGVALIVIGLVLVVFGGYMVLLSSAGMHL